jgi:hypothetical protein
MREIEGRRWKVEGGSGWAAVPMYVLLALDVTNGLVSLFFPGVFTPVALAVKAVIALVVSWFVGWSAWDLLLVWLLMFVSFFCLALIDVNTDSLMLLVKVCSVLLLFRLVRRCADLADQRGIASFMLVGFSVLALSSVLGLFGIGYDRYLDIAVGLRSNGFLPAGNEMNVALVAIFWWLSEPGYIGLSQRTRWLLYWLCLLMMVASFSKTTVLAAAIVIVYRSARTRWGPMFAVMLLPLSMYILVKSSLWERWEYFYHQYADQGFLSAVTAVRMARVTGIEIEAEALLTRGAGVLVNTGGYIESDPLDMLYNFGIAGLTLYVLFVAIIWRLSTHRMLPVALILAISVLAGHVIYSVFAVPFIVCSLVAVNRVAEAGGVRLHQRIFPVSG